MLSQLHCSRSTLVGVNQPSLDHTQNRIEQKIPQLDGNISDLSIQSDNSDVNKTDSNDTIYSTEDEAFDEPIPANLHPVQGQLYTSGKPITLDVNLYNEKLEVLHVCFKMAVTTDQLINIGASNYLLMIS